MGVNATGPNPGRPAVKMLMLAALALAAAAGCPRTGGKAAVPGGKVFLKITPDHAHVYVDEILQGTGATFTGKALRLPQGRHRLKVTAEDYFPEYVEIVVTDSPETVSVELRKVPPLLYP
jgi:hypothetical protein